MRVCVTGASGFIGSHVVRELLSRNYQVRATVRDPADEEKVKHLRALGDVELVAADLMKAGSFDKAIEDCPFVVHAASAVLLTAKDPQREIVDVAVQGTQNVLASIKRAGTVKRLVQTSSIAAIVDSVKPDSYVFTETDWNLTATVDTDPYALSKALAEKEALRFSEQHGLEFAAINPVFVQGPVLAKVHLRTSPSLIKDFMTGKYPGCPQLSFGVVDVRDVAKAHVNALESKTLSQRYICSNVTMSLLEIANALRSHFPDRSIPKRKLPNFLMYGMSVFDRRLSFDFLRRNLGRRRQFENKRVQEELELRFTAVDETLADTARSMLELGFVS